MTSLNYHHLLYFWVVARHGSVAGACSELRLAQPTISAQIRTLEDSLGAQLFVRNGRGLTLTDVGRVVQRYADEIFSLGDELVDRLKGEERGHATRLRVGIVDALPKLIAYRLLAPALHGDEPMRVMCYEGKPDRLLAELSVHGLDLILADAPIAQAANIRAFNHPLGESPVALYATAPLAKKYRPGTPASLNGAPTLLPSEGSALRRTLDQWFTAHDVHPRVVGEFDDNAMLMVFGESGAGLVPGPEAVAGVLRRRHALQLVHRLDGVRERFYAITAERRLKNPAVVAIAEQARARPAE